LFTRPRWQPVTAAIAAIALTALAGCSGSSTATGATSTSSSAAPSSAAPGSAASSGAGAGSSAAASSAPSSAASSPVAAASSASGGSSDSAASLVPAAIKSKGTLTVATDATYAPNEFIKPGTSTIIGLDPDLAVALGKQLGLKLNLVNASFDTIIPGMQSGKYDMGLSAYTDTKAREKVVDFVVYYQTGESFFVKSSDTATYAGLESLCGKKVSVETGTTEQADAQAQSAKCTAAGKPKVEVLSFADQNAANLAVSSGRADLGFADTQVVGYMITQSNGEFKETGNPVNVTPSGIALPKGNGMAPAIQAALKNLIADGTYATIFKQWGMEMNMIPASKVEINAGIS
jgi:polar amino acid transport system substrate-binding protein